MLPLQPNKMAAGHQTHKLGRQSSDDHNCQIRFPSLQMVMQNKMQINHFPIISLSEIFVAMATKPRGRSPYFQLFWIAFTQATFIPNQSHTASVVLKKLSFKHFYFQNGIMPWQQTKWPLIIKYIN